MGILTCSRCGAKTEAESIEEGRQRLDHAIGLYKRKPCQDGRAELIFTGNSKEEAQASKDKNKTGNKPVKDFAKKMIDKTKQQTKDLFHNKSE